MTLNDIQRAHLAMMAVREAGEGGALEQMKAICYCIRNRVRQGWHGGDWIQVLEHLDDARGNVVTGPRMVIDAGNRNFQRLIMEIDEIYFSRRDYEREPSNARMPDLEEAIGKACYWLFINQPVVSWFEDHILKDPKNHPQKANMGLMLFFE